jgi:hypothetical protein
LCGQIQAVAKIRRNLLSRVLKREWLADDHRDQHDDQQPGVDAKANADDRPIRWTTNA